MKTIRTQWSCINLNIIFDTTLYNPQRPPCLSPELAVCINVRKCTCTRIHMPCQGLKLTFYVATFTLTKVNLKFNPSTIDGCGKGARRSGRGPQAILEGNHDNPESGTHQAPSQWESQWREAQILTTTASREEGGLGQITTITTARKSNEIKMIDSCESTVKSLRPC